MDVTPPSVLRRLGIALAGLAVAALTGAACALSFDDLRALAITGEARQDLAFLYPAAFDALLVVALIGVLLLSSARLLVRVQAAIVLVLLIAAAAAADVATATRFAFDVRQAAVGVALAPWVMLAVALWLWLLLIKHVQTRRMTDRGEEDDGTAEPDIVPFHRGRPAHAPPPPLAEPSPPPLAKPSPPPVAEASAPTFADETPASVNKTPTSVNKTSWPAHEQTPPAHEAPVSAQVAEWPAQEPAVDEPVREREAAHESSQDPAEPWEELRPAPEPEPEPRPAPKPKLEPAPKLEPEPEPEQPGPTPEAGSHAASDPETRPAAEPGPRPVRWGDRVKPTDVLVHPRRDDRDADTQPHPIFADDDDAPDPRHGPEQADATELQEREDESADTAPHPLVHDDTPAPSGRLRSTPRPPEDD
jgi:hypothetical protein